MEETRDLQLKLLQLECVLEAKDREITNLRKSFGVQAEEVVVEDTNDEASSHNTLDPAQHASSHLWDVVSDIMRRLKSDHLELITAQSLRGNNMLTAKAPETVSRTPSYTGRNKDQHAAQTPAVRTLHTMLHNTQPNVIPKLPPAPDATLCTLLPATVLTKPEDNGLSVSSQSEVNGYPPVEAEGSSSGYGSVIGNLVVPSGSATTSDSKSNVSCHSSVTRSSHHEQPPPPAAHEQATVPPPSSNTRFSASPPVSINDNAVHYNISGQQHRRLIFPCGPLLELSVSGHHIEVLLPALLQLKGSKLYQLFYTEAIQNEADTTVSVRQQLKLGLVEHCIIKAGSSSAATEADGGERGQKGRSAGNVSIMLMCPSSQNGADEGMAAVSNGAAGGKRVLLEGSTTMVGALDHGCDCSQDNSEGLRSSDCEAVVKSTRQQLQTASSGCSASNEVKTASSGCSASNEVKTASSGCSASNEVKTASSGCSASNEVQTASSGCSASNEVKTASSGCSASNEVQTASSGCSASNEVQTASSGCSASNEVKTASSGYSASNEVKTASSGCSASNEVQSYISKQTGISTTDTQKPVLNQQQPSPPDSDPLLCTRYMAKRQLPRVQDPTACGTRIYLPYDPLCFSVLVQLLNMQYTLGAEFMAADMLSAVSAAYDSACRSMHLESPAAAYDSACRSMHLESPSAAATAMMSSTASPSHHHVMGQSDSQGPFRSSESSSQNHYSYQSGVGTNMMTHQERQAPLYSYDSATTQLHPAATGSGLFQWRWQATEHALGPFPVAWTKALMAIATVTHSPQHTKQLTGEENAHCFDLPGRFGHKNTALLDHNSVGLPANLSNIIHNHDSSNSHHSGQFHPSPASGYNGPNDNQSYYWQQQQQQQHSVGNMYAIMQKLSQRPY